MIPLTDRQMRTYRYLWAATDGGSKPCLTSAMHIPGIPAATRKHALVAMRLLGIIDMVPVGKYRSVRVLMTPDRVRLGTPADIAKRHCNKNGREPKLRDRGEFIAAMKKARVAFPRNVHTTCHGRFQGMRADARVL